MKAGIPPGLYRVRGYKLEPQWTNICSKANITLHKATMAPKEFVSFHFVSKMNSSNEVNSGGLAYCLRQKHVMPCLSFSYRQQKEHVMWSLGLPRSNSGAVIVTNAPCTWRPPESNRWFSFRLWPAELAGNHPERWFIKWTFPHYDKKRGQQHTVEEN